MIAIADRPLPDFLQKLIDNPPTAGSGVHDYMFDVARNLHAHMPAGQIEALLRAKLANCGRLVPDRELKDAIKNAMDFAWQPRPGQSGSTYSDSSFAGARATAATVHPKPKPDLAKIEKLVCDGTGVADLWHSTPFWFDEPNTEAYIDLLFPGDPLLCCGESASSFNTLPRGLWRDQLQSQSFIVPSPMTALTGVTKNGKVSAHCNDNTGPRRFLVIEFDFSEFARDGKTPTVWQPMLQRFKRRGITVQDMCANLLLRLNRAVPMTMAVHSGGKSVHGWWYCWGQNEDRLKKFHDYAVTLGADPATWRNAQFVRMPDGTRENGNPQPVLYFNPSTLPRHELHE